MKPSIQEVLSQIEKEQGACSLTLARLQESIDAEKKRLLVLTNLVNVLTPLIPEPTPSDPKTATPDANTNP